ncbi:hypothetical protein Zm00014a_035187, partial [Zea mays]
LWKSVENRRKIVKR